MRNLIYSFLISLTLTNAFCQTETNNTYFEQINDSTTRFFFDQNYFLVDKNCEFRSIQRVAQFLKSSNQYHGPFTDYAADGTTILVGHYLNGAKDGEFKAYHANQQLKWEVNFKNNKPTGNWNYYYPDGKPLLSINFTDSVTKVVSMWDRRGRLRIKEGDGTYEFNNPIDGYSKYGFPFYQMKGKIRNGFPHGTWAVYYEQDGQIHQAAEEVYQNGVFKSGFHFYEEEKYAEPIFSILPFNNFYRAEQLLSKNCTFDDFTGFSLYLSQLLNNAYSTTILLGEKGTVFSYEVLVNKNGKPKDFKMLNELPQQVQKNFLQVLEEIDYYIPSFVEGQYINDLLTISGHLDISESGVLDFKIKGIQRDNEGKHRKN